MFFLLKVFLSALIISFCSWLSKQYPKLAGFIIALPITTLLSLLFSRIEVTNPQKSVLFAKSVFVAVPVTLLFFIPFLLAEKLHLNFWSCYLSGLILLFLGYWLHRYIVGSF